jgi:hypothetical protein
MASDQDETTLIEKFAQELSSANPDGMRHMLECLLNVVMRT